MWCWSWPRLFWRLKAPKRQSGPRYTQTANISLPWSSCTFCSAISSSGWFSLERWGVLTGSTCSGMWATSVVQERANKLKKSYYPLVFQKMPAHDSTRISGFMFSMAALIASADEVYFLSHQDRWVMEQCSGLRRIHGLCNIFSSLRISVLKGHKPNICPSDQTTNTYAGVLMLINKNNK